MTVHAAIDVGTNSFHLVVARTTDSGRIDVLTQEKEVVRLGSGSGDMKELTDDAMDRGVGTLRRFRQVAEIFGSDLVAVATSAVREAANRDVFVRRAWEEAGVHVEVISGVEEARLIRLGALQAVPVFDQRHLVIDIGGGSTEFVVGQRSEVLAARSVKLGAVRLTDRFFADGRSRKGQVRLCREHLRSYLNPVVRDLEPFDLDVVVGSSGTIENLTEMAARRRGDTPGSINGMVLTSTELDSVVDDVLAAKTSAERTAIPGLDPKRADIIVAGALLLQQALAELGIDELTASAFALREGVLIDRQAEPVAGTIHHLSDPRRTSVGHLAEQFDPDADHSAHSTELALSIFDQTVDLHGLGEAERDLLDAAGLLHNVGLAISHASHHKHSYYVIRNSELLTGFTDRELELIAQIARYHRKSAPKAKHDEFAALDDDDRRLVQMCAAMLRLGIALDRTHAGVVDEVTCSHDDGTLTVTASVESTREADLELYTADERSGPLADALGVDVDIELARHDAVRTG